MALQNVHKCASVVSFSLVNIGEKVVKKPVTKLILRFFTTLFYSFFSPILLPHSTSFLGLVRSDQGPLHPHSGADPPQYGPSAWRRATPFSGSYSGFALGYRIAPDLNRLGFILQPRSIGLPLLFRSSPKPPPSTPQGLILRPFVAGRRCFGVGYVL